ncbi:MAG: TlpA family protein disulfide reductase [Deltaproteobacteria bacterium]|nr:TlpA family protein disulfide reductase [Deltaproteobacteria bacterium]
MKKSSILLAVTAAVVLIAAFLWYRGRPVAPGGGTASPPAASVDRIAPPFTLSDISGNNVSSSQFLGKPTVINFFATWCPPCREEIPGFVEIYKKYKNSGFELVGIALDTDTRSTLPQFLVQNRIEYRILIGDVAAVRAYGGVRSIPTTFFVGKDGKIRNVHVGYIDKDSFEREVRKLL